MAFATIDELEAGLEGALYLPERGLSTALYLSLSLQKPLLLEGEAGVGKTEAAKALAAATSSRLIRLQCYEGLDVAHAVYEWNYSRQLLHIRAAQEGTVSEEELFGPGFLIRRPLLEAIESTEPVVLLIDEIDRADDEFEAFLLELLSDFQVSIPELGTITATRRPPVVLTSNRTRELHDALKRRCLYHWIDYPSVEREIEIVRTRLPGLAEQTAQRPSHYYYGGHPQRHFVFWSFYGWRASAPRQPPIVQRSPAALPQVSRGADYRPASRPTLFSSRTLGGGAGVGKQKPSGFGRVSVRASRSTGSITAVRTGRSGSFGRAGGWGSG